MASYCLWADTLFHPSLCRDLFSFVTYNRLPAGCYLTALVGIWFSQSKFGCYFCFLSFGKIGQKSLRAFLNTQGHPRPPCTPIPLWAASFFAASLVSTQLSPPSPMRVGEHHSFFPRLSHRFIASHRLPSRYPNPSKTPINTGILSPITS